MGESSNIMDVYMRMCADPERDYCLALPRETKISDFDGIFRRIPVKLNPSYFYDEYPVGFAASVHPGYLTAEGAILFAEAADTKPWLKHLDPDLTLAEAVAEGQLIVPQWHFNQQRHLTLLSVLLGWLYLDLPESISPTPQVAPTKVFFWFVGLLFPEINENESSFSAWGWQALFFFLHFLKVLFVYFILRVGIWHPKSLNIFRRYKQRAACAPVSPTREELMSIGWTGIRRMGREDWPGLYRGYRIKRAGGGLEAYKSGLLDKPIGIDLKQNEGWNVLAKCTPSTLPRVDENFLNADGKFTISEKYLREVAAPTAEFLIGDNSVDEKLKKLREFRRLGYLDGPPRLVQLFEEQLKTHVGHGAKP